MEVHERLMRHFFCMEKAEGCHLSDDSGDEHTYQFMEWNRKESGLYH